MGKPSKQHLGGRYRMVVNFDMPSIPPYRNELRDFVKEALESMGGCRHPDDVLFHSLGQVTVQAIERK